MDKVILYNPAVSTMNTGDVIISESSKEYIHQIFPIAFYTEISTHLPVSLRYMFNLRKVKYRFVCGSNLLKKNMLFGFRQWNISLLKAPVLGKSILIGCGWWQYQNKVDLYSKILLRTVLSSEYMHSVRDEYTKNKLNEIGIHNVLNTGCPTMWKFTKDFCRNIHTEKATDVITTLTDYHPDQEKDTELLNVLTTNYRNVYLWIQGFGDYDYYMKIKQGNWNNVIIVNPGLNNYDSLLSKSDIEYIGTRLHAGIRALQQMKRTMIIAVDNRAIEKKHDFNLPVISRHEQHLLPGLIDNPRVTDMHIPEQNIQSFLNQFKNNGL